MIPGLIDCAAHAPGVDAELFVVEGLSAAEAVIAVRNPSFQAVMPIQGKPLNALRASPGRLQSNSWFASLTNTLGAAAGCALPLGELRYGRVLLLLDPDADGIHIGALLQMFFYRCMRALFERGQIEIVHAPWGEVRSASGAPFLAYHEHEFQQLCRRESKIAGTRVERIRHRGLGSITPSLLERTCINPRTRTSRVLTIGDAEAAIAVFGGERSPREWANRA